MKTNYYVFWALAFVMVIAVVIVGASYMDIPSPNLVDPANAEISNDYRDAGASQGRTDSAMIPNTGSISGWMDAGAGRVDQIIGADHSVGGWRDAGAGGR